MGRTNPAEHGPHPASHDHPVLRLVAQGAVLELLWAVGLLVVLGVASLMIWALLDAVGTM
jgi:hypothetical protein